MIRNLCDRAVLLSDGYLIIEGNSEAVISDYVKDSQQGVSSEVKVVVKQPSLI